MLVLNTVWIGPGTILVYQDGHSPCSLSPCSTSSWKRCVRFHWISKFGHVHVVLELGALFAMVPGYLGIYPPRSSFPLILPEVGALLRSCSVDDLVLRFNNDARNSLVALSNERGRTPCCKHKCFVTARPIPGGLARPMTGFNNEGKQPGRTLPARADVLLVSHTSEF